MALHRTQIYLDDEEIRLLGRSSEASGASRSELIRRAIRATFGMASTEERHANLLNSAGSWKGHSRDALTYLQSHRSDSAARRKRLGLD